MSKDIVERCRDGCNCFGGQATLREAADEIERLRQDNDNLRVMIQTMADANAELSKKIRGYKQSAEEEQA